MRLIDADNLRQDWIENGETKNGIICVTQRLIPFYKAIDTSPTIDPETLPIVQELKQQLVEVTNERDAIIKDLKYYLETNEENGVVYIPKFTIEKILYGGKQS